MFSRWRLPLVPTLMVLVLLVVMMNLGFWQLRRMHEKQSVLNAAQMSVQGAPNPYSSASVTKAYQRIEALGHFGARHWLLDNQTENGQVGYHVLSLFELTDGGSLVVDRGFIAHEPYGAAKPVIRTSKDTIRISGYWIAPSLPWRSVDYQQLPLTQPMLLPVLDWPKFLQTQLETPSQNAAATATLLLRLDEQAPEGFVRHWQLIAGDPEMHRSYAVQWFAMSGVLLLVYGVYLRKRIKPERHANN